jgi:hypothetical protein
LPSLLSPNKGTLRFAETAPERVLAQVSPRDPDLHKKLAHCEKEVKRIRFEEAVATPVSAPARRFWVLDLEGHQQGGCEGSFTG